MVSPFPLPEEDSGRVSPEHELFVWRNASERDEPEVSDAGTAPGEVSAALSFGLDLIRHGAMIVGGNVQPQVANSAAREILQKKDGILLSDGGLVADRASDTRLLHRLLRQAVTCPESGEPRESPVTLRRKFSRSSRTRPAGMAHA